MPNIWEDCAKIHEGCGGVCRWVEAVDRPGVGWHGECLHCDATRLSVEDMIPLERVDVQHLRQLGPTETLAGLSWEYRDDWDANQERLATVVDELTRRPYYVAGRG